MPYACTGCGRAFDPTGSTVGLFCETCQPITIDTLTDDDIKEAIAVLDTDLGILHAALKIKRGPLVQMMRKGAVDAISARCLAEVLEARAAKEPR